MNIAHPKTDIRRTFLAKLSFEFMADIVTIELGFRQQVVAEALKYLLKFQFARKVATVAWLSASFTIRILPIPSNRATRK